MWPILNMATTQKKAQVKVPAQDTALLGMKRAAANQKEVTGSQSLSVDNCKAFKEAGFRPKMIYRSDADTDSVFGAGRLQ